MTASEWRAKTRESAEAVDLTLPSGMTIRARRPDPMQLAQWQMLPLHLMRASEGPASISDEDAVRIAELMRELLVWCCLAPAVSLTPGPEEIHPREIPQPDWMFVVAWALRMKEADTLRPFRGERPDCAAAGGGEAVLRETFESAGDRGSVPCAGVRPGSRAASDGDCGER